MPDARVMQKYMVNLRRGRHLVLCECGHAHGDPSPFWDGSL